MNDDRGPAAASIATPAPGSRAHGGRGAGGRAGATDRRWLYAWGLASVAFGAVSLLVPLYVVQLGGGPAALGALGAVAAFVAAPASVLWGRLADRTGDHRGVVLSSLVVVAVVLAAMPLVASVPHLVAANAVVWLAVAAASPVLTLVVVAGAPAAEWSREIALLNRYREVGWAGGLLGGAVWTSAVGRLLGPLATQRLLFLACAVVVAAAAGVLAPRPSLQVHRRLGRFGAEGAARLLAEARRGVDGGTFPFVPLRTFVPRRASLPGGFVRPVRRSRTLVAYYAGVGLSFAGFAAFFAPVPGFLRGVGYSSNAVFGLYLVSSLAAAASYPAAGDLSARVDLRVLQSGALSVRGAAIALVAVAGTALAGGPLGVGVVAVLFALVGLSWAVVAVTAGTIVTRLSPGAARGEALGGYAAASAFAGGVGSVAGGVLAGRFGFVVAFGAAGGLVLAGAGVVATLRGVSAASAAGEGGEPSAAWR